MYWAVQMASVVSVTSPVWFALRWSALLTASGWVLRMVVVNPQQRLRQSVFHCHYQTVDYAPLRPRQLHWAAHRENVTQKKFAWNCPDPNRIPLHHAVNHRPWWNRATRAHLAVLICLTEQVAIKLLNVPKRKVTAMTLILMYWPFCHPFCHPLCRPFSGFYAYVSVLTPVSSPLSPSQGSRWGTGPKWSL